MTKNTWTMTFTCKTTIVKVMAKIIDCKFILHANGSHFIAREKTLGTEHPLTSNTDKSKFLALKLLKALPQNKLRLVNFFFVAILNKLEKTCISGTPKNDNENKAKC